MNSPYCSLLGTEAGPFGVFLLNYMAYPIGYIWPTCCFHAEDNSFPQWINTYQANGFDIDPTMVANGAAKYCGWFQTIIDHQTRLCADQLICNNIPVLLLCSASNNDTVLDTKPMVVAANEANPSNFTYTQIPGAIHNVFMSELSARRIAYKELFHFLDLSPPAFSHK